MRQWIILLPHIEVPELAVIDRATLFEPVQMKSMNIYQTETTNSSHIVTQIINNTEECLPSFPCLLHCFECMSAITIDCHIEQYCYDRRNLFFAFVIPYDRRLLSSAFA